MPKRKVKTKFFEFDQNNSGGHFVTDKNRGIGYVVIVEATSAEDANDRAEQIGLYFDGDGDCECCGDRWGRQWPEYKGTDSPCINGADVSQGIYRDTSDFLRMGLWGAGAFIHYFDGTFKEVIDKTKKQT